MTILSGQSIRRAGIITPFHERTLTKDGLSYGVGPASYDVRLEFDPEGILRIRALAPGEFFLASTIEKFKMPLDVLAVAHDKSTWARRGIAVQNTVIDPGWCGYLTLELTNHGSNVVLIKRGDPIVQVVFHRLDEETEKPYAGRYQNQRRGPTILL